MTRIGLGVRLPHRQGPPSVFLPNKIVSSFGWWRSDLGITLNGADVSAWADQIGTNHLLQATEAKQPLYVATGGPGSTPYVAFDGVAHFMQVIYTLAQPWTIMAIIKPSATADATGGPFAIDGGIIFGCAVRVLGANTVNGYYGTSATISHTTTADIDDWQVIRSDCDGAANGTFTSDDDTPSTSGSVGTVGAAGMALGAAGSEAAWADTHVAEVCMFNAVLGAADIARMRAYFAARYGL